MWTFTRIYYFCLVVVFCEGDEVQPPHNDTIYVSTPSNHSLSERQTPRIALRSLHNVKETINGRALKDSGALFVLNLPHNQSVQVDSTTIQNLSHPDLFTTLLREILDQKLPQTYLPVDETADSPEAQQSLRDIQKSTVTTERQPGADGVVHVSPKFKWNVLDRTRTETNGKTFPLPALRCGIPVKGVLDLSHRKLSEAELREKMDPSRCKDIMDKIRVFDASYNDLEVDLRTLISLLINMKNVRSINVSYNKITTKASREEHFCYSENSKLLSLNLSHNPLYSLQNLCLPPSLTSIDLSFTNISQIPSEFGLHYSHLENMYIRGNPFIYYSEEGKPRLISRSVISLAKREELSLIDVPNRTLIESLPHHLKLLDLSSCSIVELPNWFASKMKKLLFLNIADNYITVTFPQLPTSLQYLDLSNNAIASINNISHFFNLTVLKVRNNQITHFPPEYLPNSIKELDISKNEIPTFPLDEAQQTLETLNISGNLLPSLSVRSSYSSLTSLDASSNLITELMDHLGKYLSALKYLNLAGNKISFLQHGSLPESLVELDISHNAINIITEETFGRLTKLNVLSVQGKHFFCSCDLYWFANTYLSSPHIQINGREKLQCSFPPDKRGLLVENSDLTLLNCSLGLQMGITACLVVLVMSTIMALCWHFDGPWYVKMGWYWCMAKRKQYEKRPEHKPYDAFISYSENDAPWTKETLLTNLEANGFKVCYHERDFKPGHPVLGNIFYCIENSHKVLFVLSPSFVNSCWCQYELYFAEHRVLNENQDSLIMVVLEDLPPNSIPQKFSKLRKVLKRKTYLKWSPEEHKQNLFWRQLTAVLKTVNEPVVLEEKQPHQ